MSAGHRTGTSGKRTSPFAKLALAAGFLLVVICVSVGVIRDYVIQPPTLVILPPEVQQQAKTAALSVRPTVIRANGASRPTFHGRVIDAVTGEPIPTFQIRLGYSYNTSPRPDNYLPIQPKQYHGGQYTLQSQYNLSSNSIWFVRVEAPGHVPVVSSPQHGSGAVDLKMSPGKDVTGIVLDATGAPVAGATVFIAADGMYVDIDPSQKNGGEADSSKAVTSADGRYTFPPQLGQFSLVALNDAGYAQEDATPDSIPPFRLAAWGKVQGRLIIAGKPGGKRDITLQNTPTPDNQGRVYTSSRTQTDADGQFHFDRVAPGQFNVSRMVRQQFPGGGYTIHPTQTESALVVSGATLHVTLGGTGRPVVGRLVLQGGSTNFKNYFVQANINGRSTPPPSQLPPQMPDNVKQGSQMGRDFWMQVFSLTPAGRDYLHAHPQPQPVIRHYAMEMGDAGHFRIEDVAPGEYDGTIFLNSTQGVMYQPARIHFVVPPVPGGYNADPLIIPDIKFTHN